MKFRLRLLGCKLDHIHFVQLFLSGHCHISGGNTSLVSGNKILQLIDFLLLTAISCLQLGFFYLVNLLEVVIVAYVAVQLLVFHMVNNVDNIVQKRNIMGDENKSILIFLKITLQPGNVLFVQIVGGLVKKKDVRFLKKKLGKKNLGTLTTA